MLHEFICDQRVARFATVDQKGQPYVVPICYVYDGAFVFFRPRPEAKKSGTA